MDINRSGENHLLSLLGTSERAYLMARCRRLPCEARQIVYRQGGPMPEAYFPLSAMASLVLSDAESRTSIEVGIVGNEGVVGMPLFLGAEKSPTEVVWQAAGECLRMPAHDFIAATDNGIRLRAVLTRYAQAQQAQTAQLVLCNNSHAVDERLCRWLLMTHDRVGEEELPLTQEFLSHMLGTRRPSVTVAAGMLEKAGLIENRRGHIRVVNRAGLEDGACECYGVLRRAFEELLSH